MVLQRLVGLGGKIQVKPNDAPVIGAHNNVVAPRVYRDGGDPLGAADQLLQVLLLLQVIHANTGLGGHKEVRLGWMEGAGLHLPTLHLAEGPHGLPLFQGVDDAHVGRRLRLGTHRGTIAALCVPRELLYIPVGGDREPATTLVDFRVLWHHLPLHRPCLGALRLLLPTFLSTLLLLRFHLQQVSHGDLRGHGLCALFDLGLSGCFLGHVGLEAGVHEQHSLFSSHS
mmetsp:Transcript_30237/g.96593  ORF Transcript_30237/g.96593 Transcript_30237/m.96593 type:complete len:227 (-) Transcript_30237:1400-2080(-)